MTTTGCDTLTWLGHATPRVRCEVAAVDPGGSLELPG